jgi:hypothetical protein
MVHDAVRRGEDEMAELTRGEEISGELLEVGDSDVEAGRDDTALVESTDEVHNDLAGTMVIDDLKVADVTVLLHYLQETNDNLGGRTHQHLALAGLLGVNHSVQAVPEYTDTHHDRSTGRAKKLFLSF